MTRFTKLGLTILVLVLLLPLSWKLAGIDPADIDPHRPWELRKPDMTISQAILIIPQPIGPKDAPVQIKAFLSSDSSCDASTIPAIRSLIGKYEGKIHAEFIDMTKPEGMQAAQTAKISCKSGVTVNGKSEFRLPGAKSRLVQLNGPVGQHNYTLEDLNDVIAFVLASKG